MKESTKNKLDKAYQFCIDKGKSTEYIIQYLQDVVSVDLDCVISYLEKKYTESK